MKFLLVYFWSLFFLFFLCLQFPALCTSRDTRVSLTCHFLELSDQRVLLCDCLGGVSWAYTFYFNCQRETDRHESFSFNEEPHLKKIIFIFPQLEVNPACLCHLWASSGAVSNGRCVFGLFLHPRTLSCLFGLWPARKWVPAPQPWMETDFTM